MPRRPPKWWFKKCVKSMTRKKVKKLHVRDAFKLCGYIWYHHTGAKRRKEILAIEKKRLAAAKRATKRRAAKRRPILNRISSQGIKTIEYWIPIKSENGVVIAGEYFVDYKWKRIQTSMVQSVHGNTITTSSGSAYHLGKQGHPDAERFLRQWMTEPSLKRYGARSASDRIRSTTRSPESRLGLGRRPPRKTSVKICRKYDLARPRLHSRRRSPQSISAEGRVALTSMCIKRAMAANPSWSPEMAAEYCRPRPRRHHYSRNMATSHFIAAAMLPHGKMSVLATGSSEQMKAIARSASKAKHVTTVVYDNEGRSMATYSLYGATERKTGSNFLSRAIDKICDAAATTPKRRRTRNGCC